MVTCLKGESCFRTFPYGVTRTISKDVAPGIAQYPVQFRVFHGKDSSFSNILQIQDITTVQEAVARGFKEVVGGDVGEGGEVGDGAGDLDDAGVGAGREA